MTLQVPTKTITSQFWHETLYTRSHHSLIKYNSLTLQWNIKTSVIRYDQFSKNMTFRAPTKTITVQCPATLTHYAKTTNVIGKCHIQRTNETK